MLNIEDFMQNGYLLADNQAELRSIILSIFSKLTIINSYDFGVRCFDMLKDLMMAGAELEFQVLNQLKSEVIPMLNQ